MAKTKVKTKPEPQPAPPAEPPKPKVDPVPMATDDKGRPLPRRHRKADMQAKRLPDGSGFLMRYDAEKKEWTGSLIIPQPDGKDNLVFADTHGGSFGMLVKLDRKYREHLIEKFKPVEPEAKP